MKACNDSTYWEHQLEECMPCYPKCVQDFGRVCRGLCPNFHLPKEYIGPTVSDGQDPTNVIPIAVLTSLLVLALGVIVTFVLLYTYRRERIEQVYNWFKGLVSAKYQTAVPPCDTEATSTLLVNPVAPRHLGDIESQQRQPEDDQR